MQDKKNHYLFVICWSILSLLATIVFSYYYDFPLIATLFRVFLAPLALSLVLKVKLADDAIRNKLALIMTILNQAIRLLAVKLVAKMSLAASTSQVESTGLFDLSLPWNKQIITIGDNILYIIILFFLYYGSLSFINYLSRKKLVLN
jgi:hypothetical protein